MIKLLQWNSLKLPQNSHDTWVDRFKIASNVKRHILFVRVPVVRFPKVEKNSSISLCRSRFRFSASSRARSEFRSLISNILYFFLSWSNSSSNLSTCWVSNALFSSSLLGKSMMRKRSHKIIQACVLIILQYSQGSMHRCVLHNVIRYKNIINVKKNYLVKKKYYMDGLLFPP